MNQNARHDLLSSLFLVCSSWVSLFPATRYTFVFHLSGSFFTSQVH